MNTIPLCVYVITAAVPEFGRSHEDVAAAAIAGGADVIQFRDKTMSDEEFTERAAKLLSVTRMKRVPLIINDRAEIAIKIGADGVHLGHEDFPGGFHISSMRQRWGSRVSRDPSELVVGVSARDFDEAMAMRGCGADYLGVGPIFATGSKSDASAPIGVAELGRICRAVCIPVVAIGGITVDNLSTVIHAGTAGTAVIAAVAQATDMQLAIQTLKKTWEQAALAIPRTTAPRMD